MSLSFCKDVADYLAAEKPIHVAVAVSGGADSLALTHFLKQWADLHRVNLTALIVDHRLRPDSTAEAHYVQSILRAMGVLSEVLTWRGDRPTSALQEKARQARYALLEGWCLSHDVHHLFLGHHLDDQFETFLMRLSRGQGIYSLSGMQPLAKRSKVVIVRPFLHLSKMEFRTYLQTLGISWIEDPSNMLMKFERVRIRDLTKRLYQQGLDPADVLNLMGILADLRNLVDKKAKQEFHVRVREEADGTFLVDSMDMGMSEVTLRFLRLVIYAVRGGEVDLKTEQLQRLLKALKEEKIKSTLGGCLFNYSKGKVSVRKENRTGTLTGT